MNKLFNIDTRNWLIFGLILFIIILFFWKPCNKPGENVAQLKSENQQLKKEILRLDDTLLSIAKDHLSDINRWQGMKDLYEVEKKEADNNQKLQQRTIDRLAATIRNNTGKPVDSSFVLVSPDFKEACDSLPGEIYKLNQTIAEKDTAINEWTEILSYEVQQRDSTIEALSGQIDKGRELFNKQNKIVEDALKAARPRGRLLGGVGLIGNETNPLGGTKINLAYQSKGGKQYQVGGILMRGGVWYEATVLVTLIK